MIKNAPDNTEDIKRCGGKISAISNGILALGNVISKGYFRAPDVLKAMFPTLDNFKYLDKHYVLNVGRNELRVVVLIFFDTQKCYIRHVFTHKEYDSFTAAHRTKGKK